MWVCAAVFPLRSGWNWRNFLGHIGTMRCQSSLGTLGGGAGVRIASACRAARAAGARGKDLSWEPLRPELVVEVAYDHMQRDRFRHVAQFRRWRPDREPKSCTYAQLEVVPPQELFEIFGARR